MSSEIKRTLTADKELAKTYEIVIGADFIKSKVDEVAEKKQKTYKMDGFRAGKVPLDIIKKKEGTVLFFTIAENAINDETFGIAEKNDYKLVANPDIEIKTMELDKDVVIQVEYTLFPTIPELDLKTLNVKKYSISTNDKDIDSTIKNILNDYKDWEDKDDEVAVGDTVRINFDGKIDGVAFDGGKGDNYPLEIGSHSFIDNFEEQLVGKKAGDNLIVSVKFPIDYHSTKLAGKQAEFSVEILKVMSSKDAVLDDDFTKKNLGIDSVEKMKDILKKELEASNAVASKTRARNEITDEIIKILGFNVPQNLVEKRFQEILRSTKESNLRKKKEEKIDEDKIRKDAENSVRLGLFLSDISKKQNITVSNNEVESALIKNAMRMGGYGQTFLDLYRKNPKMMDNMRNEILENKIIDYIIDNSSGEIVNISAEDFRNLK
jgi:trigger factor